MDRIEQAVGDDRDLGRRFRDFLERSPDADLDLFYESVDDSDYSLADWIAASVAFDRWLDSRGISRRPFAAMVGYIHCCTMTNSPVLDLPELEVVVRQSLEEFGFDEISKNQN